MQNNINVPLQTKYGQDSNNLSDRRRSERDSVCVHRQYEEVICMKYEVRRYITITTATKQLRLMVQG